MGLKNPGSAVLGYNQARYTQPSIQSATPTAWTTGNSPVSLFTVTGSVLARVYGVVGSTAFTSTSNTGTLAVGVSGNTAVFLAQGTVSGGGQFAAGAAWVDATPTVAAEAQAAATWIVCNSSIILTIATNSMTAGSVVVYCDWIPLSPGASVVSLS